MHIMNSISKLPNVKYIQLTFNRPRRTKKKRAVIQQCRSHCGDTKAQLIRHSFEKTPCHKLKNTAEVNLDEYLIVVKYKGYF